MQRTQQRRVQRSRQRSLRMHDASASGDKRSKGGWWVLIGIAAAFVAWVIFPDAGLLGES